MDNVIYAGVMFVLTLGGFLLGKYVFPKMPADVTAKLTSLSAWAKDFVVWAKDFLVDKTGPEKMAEVIKKLQEIAKEAGWNVTEDQLKAIAQNAYNAMMEAEKKKQEETATVIPLEAVTAPAATVVINTHAPATVQTEKVAVATDNVPAGATEKNADGTLNVYDAAGNIVGSVTEEEAEKMAADVTKIVIDEAGDK